MEDLAGWALLYLLVGIATLFVALLCDPGCTRRHGPRFVAAVILKWPSLWWFILTGRD